MKKIAMLVFIILMMGGVSEGMQTKVTIRAKSKDAKFIGSTMGGALVVVRDAETGELLSKGLTSGGTGNTQKIMVEPVRRGTPITDDSTAKFEANVDINEPRLVTIEVSAPYGQRQSIAKNSAQVWLIPGKDIAGDGITIEVYGFSVDLLIPQAHETIRLADGKAKIPVRANVVMMCGCPITPDGLWDANKYEVRAIVKINGAVAGTVPMAYANKVSTFEGVIEATKEGTYEVTVYSFDPATGNAGTDKTSFMVVR